jgi:hypothetical protein
MSKFYFDWFFMCYSNEPPTVTESQLNVALERNMLSQDEYQAIIDIRLEPVPEPEPIPEEETPPEEPPAENPPV